MNTPVLLITMSIWLVINLENTNADENANYVISPIKLNWFRASLYCRRRSMFLVAIDSEAKHKIISEMKEDQGWQTMWSGGTDNGEEGVFRWESSGRKMDYQNWIVPADNNDRTKNCIEISSEKGDKWNDVDCNIEYNFMCERPVGTIC